MRDSKVALYILSAPAVFIWTCLLFVLSLSTCTQLTQLYDQGLNFNINPSMDYIGNFLRAKSIHSPWLFILITFCIYKTIMKYQLALKRIYYDMRQLYYSFEFHFTAINAMPGLFNTANSSPPLTSDHTSRKRHPHKKNGRNKDLAFDINNVSEKPSKNKLKTVINAAVAMSEQILIDTNKKTTSNDWIVVKENKKNKRSPPVVVTPDPLPKRRHSNKVTSGNKMTTPPTKNTTAKKSTQKTNTHVITHTTMDKKNGNCKNHASLVSSHQAWSNIVSQDIQTIKQEDSLVSEESSDHDLVPCLSDSESIAGSIESPCLSTRGLIHEEEDEKLNYYSPFSTGFDFGVSVPIVVEKSRPYTPGRLDKCLLSQRWTNSHLDNNHSTKKPSGIASRTMSILNLLNQADQVETSITPNSFRYFDEMMMSNSLYKSYRSTSTEQDDEWMRNRRNWNSIASSFVR